MKGEPISDAGVVTVARLLIDNRDDPQEFAQAELMLRHVLNERATAKATARLDRLPKRKSATT